MIKIFLFKSGFIRSVYSFIRFVYFAHILKKYSFLHDDKKNEIEKIDLKALGYDNSSDTEPEKYFNKIRDYEKKALIESSLNIKNIKNIFSGNRSSLIISPILSCRFINRTKAKVLSIGPRTEGEIFNLMGNGFNQKNITAVDLQSYSPLIKVGDIHNLEYLDNTFDVIICGWTIAYSYNKTKAASEIIRVAKNNAIISISGTYAGETKGSIKSTELIGLFKKNTKKILFNLAHNDFPDEQERKHSIITLIVEK